MINYLRKTSLQADKHGHNNSIIDWAVVGSQTGYRGKEWIQTSDPLKHGFTMYKHPTSIFKNMIYACCREDFFYQFKNLQAVPKPLETPQHLIAAVGLRWRYQKNGQHGQMIYFQATLNTIDWCIVNAALNIIRRFKLLCNKKKRR